MKQNNIKNIYRGDIIWVDLGEFPGSHRQSGKRPCLVVSTDKGNGPVYTVMPGTQQAGKESISGTCDSISEGCLWKAWKNNGFHGRAACNNR